MKKPPGASDGAAAPLRTKGKLVNKYFAALFIALACSSQGSAPSTPQPIASSPVVQPSRRQLVDSLASSVKIGDTMESVIAASASLGKDDEDRANVLHYAVSDSVVFIPGDRAQAYAAEREVTFQGEDVALGLSFYKGRLTLIRSMKCKPGDQWAKKTCSLTLQDPSGFLDCGDPRDPKSTQRYGCTN
jgi:hypothetical protein